MSCDQLMSLPFVLFFFGVALVGWLTAKQNSFSLKETLLALIGMKPFERTPLINGLLALTILASLGLFSWASSVCPM